MSLSALRHRQGNSIESLDDCDCNYRQEAQHPNPQTANQSLTPKLLSIGNIFAGRSSQTPKPPKPSRLPPVSVVSSEYCELKVLPHSSMAITDFEACDSVRVANVFASISET